jgi:hypothetical protein
VAVPTFAPRDGVKIQTPEEAEADAKAKAAGQEVAAAAADDGLLDVDAQCAEVAASLPPQGSLAGLALAAVDFDKVRRSVCGGGGSMSCVPLPSLGAPFSLELNRKCP